MTPVTRMALICRWQTPNAPTRAALPSIIIQTREHDIDKFCIPENFIQISKSLIRFDNFSFLITYSWMIV